MPIRRSIRLRPSLLIPLVLMPGIVAIILVGLHSSPSATPALPTSSPTSATATATPARTEVSVSVPTNRSWQSTNLTVETDALVADPSNPGTVLAGTIQGLWSSTNGGAGWKRLPSYPTTSAVLALAVGGNPRLLYAADNDGFIRVRTRQGVWRAIGPSPAPGSIFSLAVSHTSPPVILAGTAGALYRGVEQGATWRWRVVAFVPSVPSVFPRFKRNGPVPLFHCFHD